MKALLDVNVLVALFDPDHVHHDAAHEWFAAHRQEGWATCPLTENGLVRILSTPSYAGTVHRPARIAELLSTFLRSGDHVFWPDDVSLCDTSLFRLGLLSGPKQLTDAYLLALACSKSGRLATFDSSIQLGAVVSAREEHLAMIPA